MKGSGFTLVELLVAVSVLAITMMLVYGVYSAMFGVVDHVERGGAAKRSAHVLFDQLQRDFSGIYKGPSGDFKAQPPADAEPDAPFLQFVTSSHLYFDSMGVRPQLVRVSYSAERSGNNSNYDIYRTENRFELSGYDGAGSGSVTHRIVEGASALSLSYKNNYGAFIDRWEVRSRGDRGAFDDSRFPSLVRIELKSGTADERSSERRSFAGSFNVPASRIASLGSGEGG